MKRLALLAAVLVLATAAPAQADPDSHHGSKCQTYTWSGFQHTACVMVNQNDIWLWQEGLISLEPGPAKDAEDVYLYEVKLFRNGALAEDQLFNTWYPAFGSKSTDWETHCEQGDSWYAWAKFKLRADSGQTSAIEYLTSTTWTSGPC